jgi:hypothetical protein
MIGLKPYPKVFIPAGNMLCLRCRIASEFWMGSLKNVGVKGVGLIKRVIFVFSLIH